MYLTQGSFFGKTGPMNPARIISPDPPKHEKYYPNRWCEDRNLRTLHHRIDTSTLFTNKIVNQNRPDNDKVHV